MNIHKSDIEGNLHKLDEAVHKVGGGALHVRDSAFKRFPFLFIFLTTFGVVATFLGAERLIAEIEVFDKNPLLMLVAGVTALLVTGTMYKKLS